MPMCICAQFMHIVYAYLFNYAWHVTTATCYETFWTTIICNIESIRVTKLEQIVKNHIFCSFLHNLCTLYILINYAWHLTTATCWETFMTTILCNIKSIRVTKVEKKANVHMCTIYAHCARTRFFPEKRPCANLSSIILNFNAKKLRIP